MQVTEPVLKKRIDGSAPASNPIIKNIESHFIKHNQISFHFGTDQFGNICNYAWKVLVTNKALTLNDGNEVVDAIRSYYNDNRIANDYLYLKKHQFNYQFIVLYDKSNWKLENNIIYVVSICVNNGKLELIAQATEQKVFQQLIVSLNGVNLTNKPLIFATTEFEGFLSDVCVPGTKRCDVSLFPGDADLVLYNNSLDSVALVEFKKHTRSGFGQIEYQSFTKYYYKDRKKYDSLSRLCKQLSLKHFYNVIYSTRDDEFYKIKVEKISSGFSLLDSKVYKFSTIQELEDILTNQLR